MCRSLVQEEKHRKNPIETGFQNGVLFDSGMENKIFRKIPSVTDRCEPFVYLPLLFKIK